ncbi:MAG: hypothetical protein M1118_07790 [Chloroflexi bacterium]|nr:hypothetical protein [Chloroflexota bacterium]
MSTVQAIVRYLFTSPGTSFNYYTPFVIAIVAAAVVPAVHFLLEGRQRVRNVLPIQQALDSAAKILTVAAVLAFVLMFCRHANVPVLSWRIWLYFYMIGLGVTFILTLRFIYGELPRRLAAHDNELLRSRYLAPPNQRQVLRARERRRSVQHT